MTSSDASEGAGAPARRGRRFLEFFAGGGMARIGLGEGWECLWANDFDAAKCAAYRENFGGDHLVERDVAKVATADIPGRADLAWASFPCQDLSLAGARRGMRVGGSTRSSVFWAFWFLVERLAAEGRAPRVLVIENVVGLASASGHKDFAALCGALAAGGYRYDAHVVDAAGFLPQSRPRLFVIAWKEEPPAHLLRRDGDGTPLPPKSLATAFTRLAEAAPARRPLRLPAPPPRNLQLSDVVEEAPSDVRWRTAAETKRLLAMMTPRHLARIEAAKAEAKRDGRPVAGALYRRTRPDGEGGSVQRAEVRFDLAGCLRTPAGGSSRQTLVMVEPSGRVRTRLMSAREAARLMGLPDDYRLPRRYTDAYKLAGDGVAAPVARWLAAQLIEPLLDHLDAQEAAAAAE
ncbi:DNA cytosine methyltransferase [Albimonas sp. CAU 1670]|uniref:DNA cytosine methyltransferase n=1 Tax=Albimonas sp. CAU 1670 TaxID=3032599 RepID=UPI0023DBC550|nr:DNA cytosine methyltransferase [Albimonas sp. CAU 1670]MDF2234236.1 DNA cytosine methyltransferase [Albimonas sp. CAU 1670]